MLLILKCSILRYFSIEYNIMNISILREIHKNEIVSNKDICILYYPQDNFTQNRKALLYIFNQYSNINGKYLIEMGIYKNI